MRQRNTGETRPTGALALEVVRPLPMRPLKLREMLALALPRPGIASEARRWRLRNTPHYLTTFWRIALARLFNLPTIYGSLYLDVIRADGQVIPLGLAGHKVVTTAGVTKIVDFLRANDTTTGAAFKFHGIGTGVTAEAIGDTALVTELTTEYNPDNTRPTGTQTNNGATVYRTVATITVDATPGAAIREHGVFSAATAGSLLDRTLFASITLSSGDSIAATYDFTCTAGG